MARRPRVGDVILWKNWHYEILGIPFGSKEVWVFRRLDDEQRIVWVVDPGEMELLSGEDENA